MHLNIVYQTQAPEIELIQRRYNVMTIWQWYISSFPTACVYWECFWELFATLPPLLPPTKKTLFNLCFDYWPHLISYLKICHTIEGWDLYPLNISSANTRWFALWRSFILFSEINIQNIPVVYPKAVILYGGSPLKSRESYALRSWEFDI